MPEETDGPRVDGPALLAWAQYTDGRTRHRGQPQAGATGVSLGHSEHEEQCIGQCVGRALAISLRADAAFLRSDFRAARELYGEVIALLPTEVDAAAPLLGRGQCEFHEHDFVRAYTTLRDASETSAGAFPAVWRYLAAAASHCNNYREAASALGQAASLDTQDGAWGPVDLLAMCAAGVSGRRRPSPGDLFVVEASCWADGGDMRAAARCLARASRQKGPDGPAIDARLCLAAIWVSRRDWRRAEVAYRRAWRKGNGVWAALAGEQLARLLDGRARPQRALRCALSARRSGRHPCAARLDLLVADLHLSTGRTAEGCELLRSLAAETHVPWAGEAKLLLATVLLDQQDGDEPSRLLDEAERVLPQSDTWRVTLARACRQLAQGDLTLARTLIMAAADAAPPAPRADEALAMGLALRRLAVHEEAAHFLSVAAHGGMPEVRGRALYVLAQMSMDCGADGPEQAVARAREAARDLRSCGLRDEAREAVAFCRWARLVGSG